MKVVEKLNALDAKFRLPVKPRSRWERGMRYWWLGIVVSVGYLALAALVDPRVQWICYGLLSIAWGFHAGFFYNERLRALGSRSRVGFNRPAE